MAKIRSLPDKFYDKDYEHNGIHPSTAFPCGVSQATR